MMSYMEVISANFFELKAAEKVSYCGADAEKEILSFVAMKATKPLSTIEGNIIRVPLT